MKTEFSPLALKDLESISSYLDRHNPSFRASTIKSIKKEIDLLSDFPNKGRLGNISGTRELLISTLPYCVPYRIKNGKLSIIRVYHMSRKPLH